MVLLPCLWIGREKVAAQRSDEGAAGVFLRSECGPLRDTPNLTKLSWDSAGLVG